MQFTVQYLQLELVYLMDGSAVVHFVHTFV